MLNSECILITGGTGSLGKALTEHILTKYPDTKRLVIFFRDEQKQFQMAQEYPAHKYTVSSTTWVCLYPKCCKGVLGKVVVQNFLSGDPFKL